jgi:iron only hydrogenase large subunit-like protein
MPDLETTPLSVVRFSPDFPSFLRSFSRPIALVSPALFDILGENISIPQLQKAFLRIGFSEMRPIGFDRYGFTDDLVSETKTVTGNSVLFSACPPIKWLVAKEYPHLLPFFSGTMAPADRTARAIREDSPDATLIFISPCSMRAEALLPVNVPGKQDPSVDFLVPLQSIFPEIVKELEHVLEISGEALAKKIEPCTEPCNQATCSGGRIQVVASTESVKTFLDTLSTALSEGKGSGLIKDSIFELIACSGGCSQGDWAPKE